MQKTPRFRRRWLVRGLQAALAVALLVFVAQYLSDQWTQLRDYTLSIDWPALLAAQFLLTGGLAALSIGNGYVLRYLGASLPWREVCRIFFISNIAKYLPGSIWALPGRMFLYQRAGIPTAVSVVAVFWEVLLMVTAAALSALLGWRFLAHYLPVPLLIVGVMAGVLGLAVLFAIIGSPRLQERARGLPMPSRLRNVLARADLWLTPRQALTVLAAFLFGWALIGASFAGMVYAVAPTFAASWWLELGGLYMGTWVVGFLIFFTPGGIGVRDVLIGLGISVLLADPLPAVVAILARITWTLAEITGVLLLSVLHLRRPAHQLTPEPEPQYER